MEQSGVNASKMLLMGNAGVGKTSMQSVIFANYPAKETDSLGFTISKQEYKFKFMGSLVLDMIDCGGIREFMTRYFTIQKQTLFQGVESLIYVFDIEEQSKTYAESIGYFRSVMTNLIQHSPQANLFILIHKIDKIKDQPQKQAKFKEKQQAVREQFEPYKEKVNLKGVFGTSIWDETLHLAWSSIVQTLIPNLNLVRNHLTSFCKLSGCDEAVLFERSTFLILAHYDSKQKHDMVRYERISNIMKRFRLTCGKISAVIDHVSVTTPKLTAVLDEYTPNISILLIFTNPEIKIQSIVDNARVAGGVLEKTMLNKAVYEPS